MKTEPNIMNTLQHNVKISCLYFKTYNSMKTNLKSQTQIPYTVNILT